MKPVLLLLLIISTTVASGQNGFKKNMVYGEFAGTGIFLSAHYERQLGVKPGFGVHLGVGYFSESSDYKFRPLIPFGANYLFTLGSEKSFIETGLAITLAEEELWDNKPLAEGKHGYKAAVIPSIGYRHHTPYNLMWRINYSPVLTKYRTISWYGGLSLGWRF